MRRREFINFLGGGAAAWPLAARAQHPAKIARIGFMRAAGSNKKEFNAFRGGLRALGNVEGQNIVIEQRYAAGAYDLPLGLFRSEVRQIRWRGRIRRTRSRMVR